MWHQHMAAMLPTQNNQDAQAHCIHAIRAPNHSTRDYGAVFC
jgi:hypothetical protein